MTMSAEYIKSLLSPYSFKMPPPAEMKVIVEVLELYKRLPCLWDQAHHLYHSKEERDKAYQILIDKYKTINPDATREIMKKKIDNMRNAYRREYKKVMAARAAGQQEHIPVLWYYHHLTFLDENKDDEGSTGTASVIIDNSIKIEDEEDNEVTEVIDDSNPYEGSQSAEESETQHQIPRKKIRLTFEPFDAEVTQSRRDEPEDSHHSLVKKSEAKERLTEAYGRTIGYQIHALEPMQRYIAEKLISELIFYGRLRKLNMQTTISNVTAITAEDYDTK
ncbi:hypothetical protein ABMA27_013863 [Loxostege sticticalis]|uniref:MADF domain-containing protein n=1 Tax=Loxostege sticticalis TaxID=481309 RepID=A0ABR3IBS2_LOXSC